MWGVATAEDGDDLASAIVAHIHERLPASSPMTPVDENRVIAFSRYIMKTFYFPVNTRDLKAAALAAIDSADSPGDAAALAQAAMSAVVNSLGHGARFLTTLGADYPAPGTSGGPQTREIASMRIVALPTMNVSDPNIRRTCADFEPYFDAKSTDGLSGFVLDLRGNEGGPLSDSSCLAGFFIKNGQTVFLTLSKQGALVKYESEAPGRKPINLPIVVLVDKRTDGAALLVAAVLQSQKHALVIGEQKGSINDGVSSLVFPPGVNRGVVLPTGEILLADKHPLASGFHVDVTMAAQDDTGLLNAARAYLVR